MESKTLKNAGKAPAAGNRVPLKEKIKCMFWDVDGTLYQKHKGIKQEHKILLYNAYAICRDPKADQNPFRVPQNMRFPTLADVPEGLKREYEALLANKEKNPDGKYKANWQIFSGEFGKDQCYSAKVISTIDFTKFLGNDLALFQMLQRLMDVHGIPQRVMTNEVYETIVNAFGAMGLSLERMKDPRIDEMFPPKPELIVGSESAGDIGILCAYNAHKKKPNPEVFRQMLQVAGLENEPERMMYIGDAELKDIVPAKNLGITTCLVWAAEGTQSSADYILRTVHDVGQLFE
ncbi:HAD hydrolase-like protein [Candidatus Micrarchaeota archaeon]|nr:HAD hydrolase-like protein [Candidatus Micrarchaeota archaeon]